MRKCPKLLSPQNQIQGGQIGCRQQTGCAMHLKDSYQKYCQDQELCLPYQNKQDQRRCILLLADPCYSPLNKARGLIKRIKIRRISASWLVTRMHCIIKIHTGQYCENISLQKCNQKFKCCNSHIHKQRQDSTTNAYWSHCCKCYAKASKNL